MNTFGKQAWVKKDHSSFPQEDRNTDTLLEIALHYHMEATKHQQEGDHEKAARDIIMALNYYRKAD